VAFSTDLATDVGKVRLLLMDLDSTRPIFTDDAQIQVFLDIEGDVKSAAALGMETIAGNRALVLQVIKLMDLETDGLSVAKSLLLVADRLRSTAAEDWAGIDFAQVVDNSEFVFREYMWKQLLAQES
jgi:hypothetical protein